MPKGESPYLPLAQQVVKNTGARGAFLYISDGELGDSWCVWAPPEVAARLPEFLAAAAEEIVKGDADKRDGNTPAIILSPGRMGDEYHELCEWICKRASADLCILYVIEGREGSGWSVFADPKYGPMELSELLHGFAEDLKREEPTIRADNGLEVLPIG